MKRIDKHLKQYLKYREDGGMLIFSEWKKKYLPEPYPRRVVIALLIAAVSLTIIVYLSF